MPARRAASAVVAITAVATAATACSDDSGSVEAFCATARDFATDNPATVFDRYDPGDPASAVALLDEAETRLRRWAGDAPGEIDDDVETIADAAAALADAFDEPDPGQLPEERTAALAEQFEEVEAASSRVTSYVREQCGVELDPAASQGSPVTPGPGSSPTTTATTASP